MEYKLFVLSPAVQDTRFSIALSWGYAGVDQKVSLLVFAIRKGPFANNAAEALCFQPSFNVDEVVMVLIRQPTVI